MALPLFRQRTVFIPVFRTWCSVVSAELVLDGMFSLVMSIFVLFGSSYRVSRYKMVNRPNMLIVRVTFRACFIFYGFYLVVSRGRAFWSWEAFIKPSCVQF